MINQKKYYYIEYPLKDGESIIEDQITSLIQGKWSENLEELLNIIYKKLLDTFMVYKKFSFYKDTVFDDDPIYKFKIMTSNSLNFDPLTDLEITNEILESYKIFK